MASKTADPKLGTWNAYHGMAQPFVVETDSEWVEVRISELASLDPNARIGTWNNYSSMAEVFVIEDGDEWRDMCVGELLALFRG